MHIIVVVEQAYYYTFTYEHMNLKWFWRNYTEIILRKNVDSQFWKFQFEPRVDRKAILSNWWIDNLGL